MALYVRPPQAQPADAPQPLYPNRAEVLTPLLEVGRIRSPFWTADGWSYWVELPGNRSTVYREPDLEGCCCDPPTVDPTCALHGTR